VRYAAGAVGTYVLFLVSPIWWVHHRLPEGSHYDSGLWGVLAENSLALGLIVLVAAMPWRPGAEPAFGQSRSRLAGVRGW
jgi:alpha-1,2-mannosyltransferase